MKDASISDLELEEEKEMNEWMNDLNNPAWRHNIKGHINKEMKGLWNL